MKSTLTLIFTTVALCLNAQLVTEDFDFSDGGWTGSSNGGNDQWQHGMPAGTGINDDNGGGGSAWVTGLSGSFVSSGAAQIYVTSTAYDLSSLSTVGSIAVAINLELVGGDWAYVEYSTNNGASWTKLGTAGSGDNWYDNASDEVWTSTANTSGAWFIATQNLPGDALGASSVTFRFVFDTVEPAGAYPGEGFAIDDFQIFNTNVSGGGGAGGSLPNEDFELSDAGWVGSTISGENYWAWGAPVGTQINDDNSGGGSAWVTGLSGDFTLINSSETMYLTSGSYDLSSLSTVGALTLALNVDLAAGDLAYVEYLINDGMSTWTKLGANGSGINWYDDAVNDAWSANSGGWTLVAHDLPFELLGAPDVSFRVVIESSVVAGNYGAEGLAIDDVQVVAATTGGPGGGLGPGTTQIKTMTLAGEIFPAVIDSTSNSVKIFVAPGTDVTALAPTFTLSDGATVDLPSGSTQDFTSGVTYTVTSADAMENTAWAVSAVVPDLNLDVYPTSGLVGTSVTVLGRGFSTTASENTLTLGGVSVPVATATENKLTFQIPANAGFGLHAVSVSVNGLNSRPGATFNVLASNVTGSFADYKDPDFNLNASSFVKSMQVGDIDNDGDLDLAYDNETILNISTIQDGGIVSTVNKVSDRNLGTDSFNDITFADVDQDGFQDIVVGGLRLGWFKNNGDGTWADEAIIDQNSTGYTLRVFDIDGDFDMDILAYDDLEVLSFTNDGTGSFARNDESVPERLGPIVDWDQDGDMDVLIKGGSDQNIVLARNDGNGNFNEETLVTRSNADLSLFQLGDLDNDGDLDFIVATEDFGNSVSTLAYIVNNGDGTFAAETSFITEGIFSTSRLELADLNNDGFLDVARTRTDGTNTSHAYYSSAALTYSSSEILDSNAGTLDLLLVDIDGDGDMDVLHEASASGGYFPLFIKLLTNAEITNFSLTTETGAATINFVAGTITSEVDASTDITMLSPTLGISPNAMITPDPAGVQNYSNPVAFTVTAEDGTTIKNWTVSVFQAPSIPTVTSSNIEQTTATLSWFKSSGGVNYELELSEASDFSSLVTGYDPLVINNPTSSTVAANLVNLNAGTTYYARVREQNGIGTFSEYSATESFATKLPSQPDLTSLRVDENAAIGTLVGTFSVTDAGGASYTYAFANGGVDNASFAINGSNLETNEVFNREVKEEYSILVESVNPLGVTSDPKEFTITINDLNDAPTNISLQTGSYNPTGFDAAGTGVADLFVTDEDGDNVTFVLTQGGDSFEVNNVTKTLLTKVVFETEVDLIIPITLEASDPSGASVSANFDVTINAFVDTERPVISPSPQNGSTFLSGGPERTLSVTVEDFRLSQVRFFSRLLTESEFVNEVLTEVDGSYTKTVQESDLGVAGFEYYFEATDEAGNVGFSDLRTLALAFPESGENAPTVESVTKFGRTVDSYQIISIPFAFNDPSAKRVDAIFNEYNSDQINREYRIIKWDPTSGESGALVNLDQASTIELGEGYFFISAKERSITIESANINLQDPFPLVLRQGWNLVGNPYNIDIDWNSVLTNNGAAGTVGALRVLDPENPETWPESNILKTLEGAFVFANQDITLNMSYTDASISFGGGRLDSGAPEAEWFLPITLEQNGDFRKGGIGMDNAASASLDMYDEPVLPKWLEYLEIAFLHEGERFSRFNKDVIPREDTKIWDFEVSSSSKGTSILKWDESSAQVANLQLYNTQNGTIIDMTKQSSYQFELNGTVEFKILYSTDLNATFDFEQLDVLEAYPNPFVESFSVPLRLPSNGFDYEVSVDIQDLSGRTIFQGAKEMSLGGVMEYGFKRPQGLKPGIYLYKVNINNALNSESYTKRIKVN